MTEEENDLQILNDPADFIVIAGEEEFQSLTVLAEKQAQAQTGPALKDVLAQPADGNSRMGVGTPETIRNHIQRGLDPRKIRVVQVFQRGAETGRKQDGGFSHA
jgi:hypothetical protein